MIEKYVSQPRHIEVQVFGDKHGNVVHFFERDCSLQRRHQKVIEEAPAPGMPETLRTVMGKAAVDAAKAIQYSGAGTIEFIVDGSGPLHADGFWFMEMNTRLQVEHPVSEAITGFDFVELQLRVASGEPLPVTQEDLSIDGWSFEARVYAEDVPKGFLPATGKVDYLSSPTAGEFERSRVRIDSGVRQGDEISPYYDPMIAKIIVHGPTRELALNLLSDALSRYRVSGTVTNLAFLTALSRHSGFSQGEVDTHLIARDLEALVLSEEPGELICSVAALSALGFIDQADPLFGFRLWSPAQHKVKLEAPQGEFTCTATILGSKHFVVSTQNEAEHSDLAITIISDSVNDVVVKMGDHSTRLHVVNTGSTIEVSQDGRTYLFTLPDASYQTEVNAEFSDLISSPMPGSVVAVEVRAGDHVNAGDKVAVIEAMKMEHTVTSSRDATVSEVLIDVGDQVQDGAILIKLEPQS